ncbi:MAG: citrate lyase subunit alpha [Enterocloster clostridioformis]
MTQCVINSGGSKLVESIHEVLVKCGTRDGMTLEIPSPFPEGDFVVNMVMEEVHKMGIRDIAICASSWARPMTSCALY